MPSLKIMYMKELYMLPPLHPLFPSGTACVHACVCACMCVCVKCRMITCYNANGYLNNQLSSVHSNWQHFCRRLTRKLLLVHPLRQRRSLLHSLPAQHIKTLRDLESLKWKPGI